MIIECINCNKKFEVNSDLIPKEGRNIQCGSCNHLWFFDKNNQYNDKTSSNTNVLTGDQCYQDKFGNQ